MAYCGAEGMPLEKEHIIPKQRGGTDRVSNLTVACRACNQTKGNRTASEFGHPEVEARAMVPLKDAAAVNVTRWALYRRLLTTRLPIEASTGGRTKWNRMRLGLSKAHWTDAACVGESTPERLLIGKGSVLLIRATGHGRRQRCNKNKHGFPISHAPRRKRFLGFQTGDLVRAVIPSGKYAGVHTGRLAIRHRPCFKLNGFDVHPRYLTLLQRADGYEYFRQGGSSASSPGLKAGAPCAA